MVFLQMDETDTYHPCSSKTPGYFLVTVASPTGRDCKLCWLITSKIPRFDPALSGCLLMSPNPCYEGHLLVSICGGLSTK